MNRKVFEIKKTGEQNSQIEAYKERYLREGYALVKTNEKEDSIRLIFEKY